MPFTKAKFLKIKDHKIEKEIEGLDDTVFFRVVGGNELETWQTQFESDDIRVPQRFAAATMVDGEGKRFFEDDQLDDFLAYPASITMKCALAALQANGLESEELDEMGKDSDPETNGDSGSS
jgi:hypothetical protein